MLSGARKCFPLVPSGTIADQDSMCSRRDLGADLLQVLIHRSSALAAGMMIAAPTPAWQIAPNR